MRLLLLVSVLVLAPNCAPRPAPAITLNLPADTFARADRPELTVEALESEAALESAQDAQAEWGKSVARRLDAACRLLRDTAVPALACRPERAEWESAD